MIYTATAEDMQQYAQLIAALTHADIQRQQCIDAIARWEKAHGSQPTCDDTVGPADDGRPAEDHPQDDGQPAE